MLTGIVLIIAGLLIAIYPPLLSLIIAAFLIMFGLFITLAAYHHRKLARKFDNPTIDLILRM